MTYGQVLLQHFHLMELQLAVRVQMYPVMQYACCGHVRALCGQLVRCNFQVPLALLFSFVPVALLEFFIAFSFYPSFTSKLHSASPGFFCWSCVFHRSTVCGMCVGTGVVSEQSCMLRQSKFENVRPAVSPSPDLDLPHLKRCLHEDTITSESAST